MKKIIFTSILFYISGLYLVAAQGLEEWEALRSGKQYWKDHRENLLSMYRNHLCANLTTKEKDILNQIKIIDSDSYDFGQFPIAIMQENRRVIKLSTAFVLEIDAFIMATYMQSLFKIDDFATEYSTQTEIAKNLQRAGNDFKWKNPFELHPLDLDKSKQLKEKDMVMMQWTSVNSGILFILAHETAHHVLGHLDGKQLSLEQARMAEFQADNWATSLFLSCGLDPYVALQPLDYMFGKDAKNPLEESQLSHPFVEERMIGILKFFRATTAANNSADKDAILARVDKEIAAAESILEERNRRKKSKLAVSDESHGRIHASIAEDVPPPESKRAVPTNIEGSSPD